MVSLVRYRVRTEHLVKAELTSKCPRPQKQVHIGPIAGSILD